MTVLECKGIAKRYGSVQAVSDASLVAQPGRIHAVVGENGAGKSTLLKVAAGLAVPDAGEVRIEGRRLEPHTAREALKRKVAMVQQHFALVEVFTALENVVLGAEPASALGRLDIARAKDRVRAIGEELGAELPLDVPVLSLGVGERQWLEIARALFRDADVLILDEPTSVLAPQEAEALYTALRRLAQAGRTIVVVTHKLDEVRAHADCVTSMRRGKVVRFDEKPAGGHLDIDALARTIMGDDAPSPLPRQAGDAADVGAAGQPRWGPVVLSVKDLVWGRALFGVNLSVRSKEIVGIAGVEGNGQRELAQVLAGLEPADSGDVVVHGKQGDRPASDRGALTAGVAVVHEDRHDQGLVLDAPVRDNLVLGELGALSRWGVLDAARIDEVAAERERSGGVRPAGLDQPARGLSGGNQQKIVMARAIARRAPVLVLSHPTRGVDLGAARLIHGQVKSAAREGAAVLVISADLAELRALCDRILVMRRGRIVASFEPSTPDAAIGAAMLGSEA